jgi:arylsulfatase A-like enzyme
MSGDAKQPNVIVIMTDDQGYGDLACHGNPVALTPQMDKLHAESVRLTDFHAAPMCTPSRGQLLTGLDAARNGAINVSSGRSLLRADLQTMADLYRAGGYGTGVFGKWHLGENHPYRPQERGFDESLWFPSSHITSLPDHWENDYFDDSYCHNGKRESYKGYCTEVFFREAKAWMKEQVKEDKPFFAYLPTNAPHFPHWVPEEDRLAVEEHFAAGESELPELKEGMRKTIISFLAMIRNVDTEIGKLREFLAAEGVADDTIIIFMTDNGSTFGPQYYNAGMRGRKVTLWEGGHRVPCFIHWPNGELGEPRDIAGLTQMQDLMPTLAELCGLAKPAAERPDGISLAGALKDDQPVPDERMLVVNYSRMSDTDYPTPDSASVMRREGAAVLWQRWRLLEGTMLFDLENDPLQEENVIEDHPEIAKKMLGRLEGWWQEVKPVANEVQYITIGSDEENPTMLSACDWMDVFVDQQRQVRIGISKNSYWHLQVARAGNYKFELCRWPRESGLALTEACTATQVTDGWKPEGRALPITQARLMIGREQHWKDIEAGDKAAEFTLKLEAGKTLLHTWFYESRVQPLCGAYYVYVTRLD